MSLMKNSGVDLVVANDIGREGSGFGSETTEVILIGSKVTNLGLDSKPKIAARILDAISEQIN
jgi:phosphopantothenoylcysteine synthetase/decarboxylase